LLEVTDHGTAQSVQIVSILLSTDDFPSQGVYNAEGAKMRYDAVDPSFCDAINVYNFARTTGDG